MFRDLKKKTKKNLIENKVKNKKNCKCAIFVFDQNFVNNVCFSNE